MKVGVISDSHGNEVNLLLAAHHLIEEKKAKTIIHLGDNYGDTEFLKQYPVKIINVPGVFSEYYHDYSIPNRMIKQIKGWKVFITHTIQSHHNDLPQDLVPEIIIAKRKARVVLYGHTHIPAIEQEDGILYINPGHLRTGDKRGHKPSYALLEFEQDKISAQIFDLAKNKIMFSTQFTEI